MRRLLKFCGAWTTAMSAFSFAALIVGAITNRETGDFAIAGVAITLLMLGPMFASGWYTYTRNRSEDAWREELATERQKKFADELGIPYTATTTKGELSALIDAAKGGEPASDRQKAYADSLGIEYADNISKQDLSALIDRATAKDGNARTEKAAEAKDVSAAEFFKRGGR